MDTVKTVVFLLGTYDRRVLQTEEPLSPTDAEMLERVADTLNIALKVVWAVPDEAYSNTKKRITVGLIREYRDNVLAEIRAHKPDVVMACGPVALQCLTNKGNAVMKNYSWDAVEVPELGKATCMVTQSLEAIAAKPGLERWLYLDTMAALHGKTEPQWGKYTVLTPGTPEWSVAPAPLVRAKAVGLDLETYPGLDPWHPDARIRMAVISDKVGRAWVVQARRDSVLPRWLTEIAANPEVMCGGSNIKFDYKWMRRFGYTITNMHDTSTAEHILDCTNPLTNLKSLTFIYCPKLGDYSRGNRQLLAERGGSDRWDLILDHEMYQYAGADGESSIAAMQGQVRKLKEKNAQRPYKLSMELYEVLAKMESNGTCIDLKLNKELDEEFESALNDLRSEITQELGPINPNAPDQLSEALIASHPELASRLSVRKVRRQFSDSYYTLHPNESEDAYTTEKAVLERLAGNYPVIGKILLYRRYQKLHGTYVTSLRDKHLVIHPDGGSYAHTSYRSDVVETFRLSSQNPPLQTFPRKPDPDDPFPIPPHLSVKRQFISRFPGGSILEGDLSQAEIRIAAHLSQDQEMIHAILHGDDIHSAMCSRFMRKPEEEVTKLERTQGKRTNFLVIYGGGANTLAAQLGVPFDVAKGMLAQYFDTFRALHTYMEKCGYDVMGSLSSTSEFGYTRYFRKPHNWESPDGYRVRRQAWNHKVQNGAGCCVFVSMHDIVQEFERRKMKSILDMQVHDSVKVDVYPGEETAAVEIVKHCLEHPSIARYGVELSVPLVADVEIGPNWGEMQKISS